MIGADPRTLGAEALAILKNEEVLAVSQDALATPVRLISPAPSASPGRSSDRPAVATRDGSACVGYVVTGAGSVGANGCYAREGAHTGANARYRMDATHELYSWHTPSGAVWHITAKRKSVLYASVSPTSAPPESDGGCGNVWTKEKGAVPCPAIKRSGLPPAPPSPPAEGTGVKLKMEACDNAADRQRFVTAPAPGGSCKNNHTSDDACVVIKKAGGGAQSGHCATVLAERWPWWVSLLPCDEKDVRQFWTLRGVGGDSQLVANTAAVRKPWPSANTGKCADGSCRLEGCLEVEGANPEVDQCNWSTDSAQFLWDTQLLASKSQLRNAMSGQCLATAVGGEVYAGPLSGGRHTAVLLNRGSAAANITLKFSELRSKDGDSMKVRDILGRTELGTFAHEYSQEVRSHAVAHLVLTPVAVGGRNSGRAAGTAAVVRGTTAATHVRWRCCGRTRPQPRRPDRRHHGWRQRSVS
eukprot:SAG11_NODE_1217_length_5498_cov_3.519444_4_plen_471_part_00